MPSRTKRQQTCGFWLPFPSTPQGRPSSINFGFSNLRDHLASRIRERARKALGLGYETLKKGPRKFVTLPTKFRMPLHAQHESIAARILDGFDQAIGRPGRSDQFPSQGFD